MASTDRDGSQELVGRAGHTDDPRDDGRVLVPADPDDAATCAGRLITEDARSIFLAVDAATSEVAARAEADARRVARASQAAAPARARLEAVAADLGIIAAELGSRRRNANGGVMAGHEATDPAAGDGATPPDRTASDVGAIVAEHVRRAIESAEHEAREVRAQAHREAATERGAVDGTAASALARIDDIQERFTRLLDAARDDVTQAVAEAHRAWRAPDPDDEHLLRGSEAPAVGEASSSRPPAEPAEPPPDGRSPVRRRRSVRRLLGRSERPPQCSVCGRTGRPDAEMLALWRRVARLGLCPECQAQGWQLPDGATVPYRAGRQEPA